MALVVFRGDDPDSSVYYPFPGRWGVAEWVQDTNVAHDPVFDRTPVESAGDIPNQQTIGAYHDGYHDEHSGVRNDQCDDEDMNHHQPSKGRKMGM